jgi:hypothetical protein
VLITLTPEINYDQTAIGLPPVASAVFLIHNHYGKTWASRINICDVSAIPSGINGMEWGVSGINV